MDIEQRSNLTRSQMLIWTGQQLSPDAPLYNMAISFELKFDVDVPKLQQAFHSVVQDSDAMRSIFTTVQDVSRQSVQRTVRSDVPTELSFVDMSDWDDAEFGQWVQSRSETLFRLDHCLYDSVLVKRDQRHYCWLLNQHHLITDAWSFTVIFRHVAMRYESLVGDQELSSSGIPQYSEHVAQEKLERSTPNPHWASRRRSTKTASGLYGRPTHSSSGATQRISRKLGRETTDRLRATILRPPFRAFTQHLAGFNLFATVLFAWQSRVTQQSDLTLGTASHNRATAATKEMIGLFIELLPMQIRVDADETFCTLAKKVQVESSLFLRNARSGSSGADLLRGFNVVLNYITASFPPFAGHDVLSQWLHPGHGDPSHHLRVQVHDFNNAGEIQLDFDMNTQLYDDECRHRAADDFLCLLDALLSDAEQPIAAVHLPGVQSDPERVAELAPPDHESKSVLAQFEELVESSPVSIAIADDGREWTFAEVNDASRQLASALRERGLKPGERVALLLPRSSQAILSMIAAWKCGSAFTPIDVTFPAERIRLILEDLDPSAIVYCLSRTPDALDFSQLQQLHSVTVDVDQVLRSVSVSDVGTGVADRSGDDTAYVLYTSGSTGRPKGAVISQRAIGNYVTWAMRTYAGNDPPVFPLFTSLSFDLTLTSIFVPLVSGGKIVVYPESDRPSDFTLLDVIEDKDVNIIKLTPSHLAMLHGKQFPNSNVRQLILGGEDLKTELAASTITAFGSNVRIHNEYGPTEATVGCLLHTFDPVHDRDPSVPIGRPIAGMNAYVVTPDGQLAPNGVIGELCLTGIGLSDGYWHRPQMTAERFTTLPSISTQKLYRTGDLATRDDEGVFRYCGRTDQQIKVRGVRMETAEIEAAIQSHPDVQSCHVGLEPTALPATDQGDELTYCVRCGLPSNYPGATFDARGECNQCSEFARWQRKTQNYFKTMEDLAERFRSADTSSSQYDCLALLSGGKDSTYSLCRLVDMGLRVLAFTLDNGYLSDEAKNNIDGCVQALGVDHVYGSTPAMNEIFVDSLQRHANVCNGCFKTIYTLSVQEASRRGIPFIVTGLSRGQFFETRLTETLFHEADRDLSIIDKTILEARKNYHRVDDAVSRKLDVSLFDDDRIFEQVQFIDFYRYCDVSLSEMLTYLNRRVPWQRPSDTGRSTNCLINDVGIHIHKKQRGYHNYAFPYSWDVRMGHKTREEALHELNDEINVDRVETILGEIGYSEPIPTPDERVLIGWYVGPESLSEQDIRQHVARSLPRQMMPARFVRIDEMPITLNGKIDPSRLRWPAANFSIADESDESFTEIETMVKTVWQDVLRSHDFGRHDNFFDVGGDSLLAMSVVAKLNSAFDIELPISRLFDTSSIERLAALVEEVLMADIDGQNTDGSLEKTADTDESQQGSGGVMS